MALVEGEAVEAPSSRMKAAELEVVVEAVAEVVEVMEGAGEASPMEEEEEEEEAEVETEAVSVVVEIVEGAVASVEGTLCLGKCRRSVLSSYRGHC